MSASRSKTISKSKYLAGRQCNKRLWFEVRDPRSVPPVNATTRARFEQGHQVGSLAQRLFPGGLEIGGQDRDWGRLTAATASAMAQNRPLFEAAFRWQGAACRVDILVPEADGAWSVYEVKSTTSIKDVHCDDLALQAFVLEGSGLTVRDYFLVHLDPSYERASALDLDALFVRQRVTDRVRSRRQEVEGHLASMHETLRLDRFPEIEIGPHCESPYDCPLKTVCWSFLPPVSVLDLTRDRQLGFEMLAEGVLELAETPDTLDLNRRQRIQLETVRTGAAHVDTTALSAFLDKLAYPLYFFDIETVASAVPRLARSRPYQQIPFLFSVHRIASPGEETRHFAHLVDGPEDPRPEFLRAVAATLGDRGSIVAYNASFETGVLAQAAADVTPDLIEWSARTRERFVDLLRPFRDFSYHHPEQLGSASLKAVLEPITGLSYRELAIADGESAGREFLRLQKNELDPLERARIVAELVEYCSLDTLAMVAIVERLRELVEAEPIEARVSIELDSPTEEER